MITLIFIVVLLLALLVWAYSRHVAIAKKVGQDAKTFDVKELDFAKSIAKRLDEHRELIESIEASTSLLTDKFWHVGHLATQDEFLMKFFYLRYGVLPVGETIKQSQFGYVRSRPNVLGKCGHPDFAVNINVLMG